ncbi:hypothetical protein [Sphingomonas quercus]|uniref:Uncharacterized protein n=1 Tax=Sphingomonas quercus TaxID=2842451 RepID=A0ABS6BK70_9SPHN|nr:hypothetical protein [Sphingomonas quercus]MBU3078022.1 hypothetical protein [Sphingomonas quercus]
MRVTPLRFLTAVIILWMGGRVFALFPTAPRLQAPPHVPHAPLRLAAATAPTSPVASPRPLPPRARQAASAPATLAAAPLAIREATRAATTEAPPPPPLPPSPPAPPQTSVEAPVAPAPIPPTPAGWAHARISGEAYLFLRDGAGAGLAPGTQLGGGQAFARLSYAIGSVAATARASRALHGKGAEAALGLRWAPLAGRGLSLSAERRVALDAAGRDAWSIFAAGGIDEARIGPLRLDAYAQIGVVGIRHRDGFADGAVRLGMATGAARIGAGLWGAAQPGAARLDIGPQATLRLSDGVTAALDGRLRIAGGATPGNSLALTLATAF